MTKTTADANRYGEAIEVNLVKGTDRYTVYSTTAIVADVDPDASDAERPFCLGWVIKDGRTWTAYVNDFAGNRSTNPFEFHGTAIAVNERTRKDAIDSLIWNIACRGRTWMVSEVR